MIPFLKNPGILGINARNLLYIRPYNKKKAVRLADSKLQTKQFLSVRDVPVPRLYASIRNQEELERFDFSSLPNSFVLKPNMGYGGEGIIPFVGKKDGQFEKASGALMNIEELKEHIGDILEGRFSLSGVMDTAFFEQMIVCDEALAKFAYKGLPDIRIVVHNLIPVMAMLRLPTRESDGKANIHLGALGVGIDIAKGTATHIVYKNKIIDEVPEVGSIRGLKIPYWDEMLLAASRVQLVSNLGYLAVDMVLDKNVGPVLLEINARAGLGVQIANLAPLRRRLERIEGIKVSSPEKGVRIAQDMFGNKLDKEVKKVSGKEVVGSMEKVKVLGGKETRIVWASVNPLIENTLIDQSLVDMLELEHHADSEQIKLKFSLADTRIQTLAQLEDFSGKNFDIVIGRRDLNNFLIDPSKSQKSITRLPHLSLEKETESGGVNYTDLDNKLVAVDRQIKLLYHLKPLNLSEEKESFLKNPKVNPSFIYPELKFDAFHLKENLKKIKSELDDSPLGKLFLEKVYEVEKKILLLEARGSQRFTERSVKLFSKPTEALLGQARDFLSEKPTDAPKQIEDMSMEEAIVVFESVLRDYGLNSWQVKVKQNMVARCLAGKQKALYVREGARFNSKTLRMLVAHEIETHIITAENGKQQKYQLFNRGWANYLETQEGLAIWNQSQVLPEKFEENFRCARHVFILDYALKHDFVETVEYCQKLGLTLEQAFDNTLRMKRGLEDTSQPGAFTKDLSYFSGLMQVKSYIAGGGDLKHLYYGKYNLRDLENIKKFKGLKNPMILPKFLS